MKKIINTEQAPKPVGPYSQAIEANGILWISGQIPICPETGKMVEGSISEQTEQVMKNIGSILNEAGYTFQDVIKSTCVLSDINDFQDMNEVYGGIYSESKPARSTFQAGKLPLGAKILIDTIAAK